MCVIGTFGNVVDLRVEGGGSAFVFFLNDTADLKLVPSLHLWT